MLWTRRLRDHPLEQKITTKLKNEKKFKDLIFVKVIILHVPQSFDRHDFSPIFGETFFSCPLLNHSLMSSKQPRILIV